MRRIAQALSDFIDRRQSWVFPAPAVIVLLLIVVFPIAFNLYLAFTKWTIGLGQPRFIGLDNFVDLLTDERVLNGTVVMIAFSGLSLALEMGLGLMIALYFNREFKGSEAVQAIYIFPFAATPVAVALIWRIMLNPEVGVLNYLLRLVGLPGSLWVSSEHTVILSLVMVDVWKWTPMITLIVLAGLKSLPHDPYEAARIDGANALQIFWHITLPMIRPVLIAALMLRSLDNLKEFDMIYTITQGGPGIASETLYLYSYTVGFQFFKAGYGSALMVVVFLIVLVFNVVMNRLRLAK
ncbi:Trehalose transport system permease protein SugA [Fundidesulfovibrio magnetotacticus]|uniref:Trehalose transport system permease protein SugA n=1 Tax=Fundidesulfovibrio magnetotacticus TaxID=2730080 RepID=A0A6V8LVQ6_9BACT|nr:sugar ABC transporter permease [Fundidesulfovibrio magnetotacticus]GFK94388.1 Trehalose transport system permease protein SugA [Fundidesulfovibrio magnetotacticus]